MFTVMTIVNRYDSSLFAILALLIRIDSTKEVEEYHLINSLLEYFQP